MTASVSVLAGASGLIGGYCAEALVADPACVAVHVLVRRPLARSDAKLTQHTVDFDRLAESALLPAVDEAYCCLGTTMKSAGSHAAFERVDLEYVRSFAKLALGSGARQFMLVSAVGADAGSAVYYNRVKGRAEEAVQALPFQCVHIFRPSLLLGARTERRPGEKLAQTAAPFIAPLLRGPLARYRPVHARDVATRMVALARQDLHGRHVHYFTD